MGKCSSWFCPCLPGCIGTRACPARRASVLAVVVARRRPVSSFGPWTQVTPMLEAGQYYGQPGYYPEWQNAGVAARGNAQAPLLSRPEAIRMYEVNLAAYHEALRRRERHTWFFA